MPPARVLKRRGGAEGGDGVGPGCESETHPRLVLLREGGGVEAAVRRTGKRSAPVSLLHGEGGRDGSTAAEGSNLREKNNMRQ
ncbi:hypothetical protein CVT26_015419 [Gymnopilus dilepis]|uniref:Uncharacterized protein n=1 Tax=Gymnopilus dilepis TaxID=231916 RepID=A0A409YEB9_9AGAR|nr:hypothetical protein CVT26_015419 [Gymnopilus dilepis]